MDLVLGQAPAIAAASSAAEAAGSATQAAASAAQAAANAASIGFTAGDSVVDDGGQLEMALPSIFKSANYSVAAQDRGKVLACTAGGITITLPAWTAVGNGFVVGIRNNVVGTGSITLLAAAGELIDGLASIAVRPGEGFLVICNGGINWRSIGRTVPPYGSSVVDDGGSLAAAMPTRSVTADYTVVAADRGHLINANGTGNRTITLPNGTSVGGNWFAAMRNSLSGTGVVTLQAAAGETIDGAASWVLGPDDAFFIQSSGGASWRTICRRRAQTVSTAAPSGGKDGDVWYQV
jgi:hypothetical protein